MKKFFFVLAALLVANAFIACESSTSSEPEETPSKVVKGSFPSNGESEFSCVVTKGSEDNGDRWVQLRLNIPKYKGMVERITIDASGTKSTQYYEESYFNLNPFKMNAMCLEFNQAIAEKEQKGRVLDDHQCGNGVSYFVYSATKRPTDSYDDEEEDIIAREELYFNEDCEDYKEDWEVGEYDFAQNR